MPKGSTSAVSPRRAEARDKREDSWWVGGVTMPAGTPALSNGEGTPFPTGATDRAY